MKDIQEQIAAVYERVREGFEQLPVPVRRFMPIIVGVVLGVMIYSLTSLIYPKIPTSAPYDDSTGQATSSTPTASRGTDSRAGQSSKGWLTSNLPGDDLTLEQKEGKYNSADLVLNSRGLPEVSVSDDPGRFMVDFSRAIYTFDTTKASYEDYISNLKKWMNEFIVRNDKGDIPAATVDFYHERDAQAVSNDIVSSADEWKRMALMHFKSTGKVSDYAAVPHTGTQADISPDPMWASDKSKAFGAITTVAYISHDSNGQVAFNNQPDSGHKVYLFAACPSNNEDYNKYLSRALPSCRIDGVGTDNQDVKTLLANRLNYNGNYYS